MSIRLATEAEAEAIAAMLTRLAGETGDGDRLASTPRTIRADGFGPGARFEVLIAEGPLGFALYLPHYSTTRAQPGAYVQDLWVAPEARGTGLGARLLAAVAARARAVWGAEYLALTTHGANAAARGFYARLGFAAQAGDVPMMLDGAGFAALEGTEAPA